jgi:hypothetical protein
MSRTQPQTPQTTSKEALEHLCIVAYPLLVSEAYADRLESRPIDPLSRPQTPTAIANAEGASIVSRAAWLELREPYVKLVAHECNDYHVCTLLDAWFREFASISTRSSGNGRQEIELIAPGAQAQTGPSGSSRVLCPTDPIIVLTHRVHFAREKGYARESPFSVEDEEGNILLDLDGPVSTFDAPSYVQGLDPETYFAHALALLRKHSAIDPALSTLEAAGAAGLDAIRNVVRKSFDAIERADRSSPLARGWSMIHRRTSRDAAPESRDAAIRAGFISAEPLDVLELATRCDSSGAALDGSRSYLMRLEHWNEPPAHASWFLQVSPAEPRHIDLVRTEAAIQIVLGPTVPASVPLQNWVPTQPQPLEVRLVLCWPSERARSELWTPPDISAID